jgi:hypothetical protein
MAKTITFDISDELYAAGIAEYGSEDAIISFILAEWVRITINNKIRAAQAVAAEALEVEIAAIQAEVTGVSAASDVSVASAFVDPLVG